MKTHVQQMQKGKAEHDAANNLLTLPLMNHYMLVSFCLQGPSVEHFVHQLFCFFSCLVGQQCKSCVKPKCTSEIWLTMLCDHIMILSSRVITVLSDACKGLHAEQSCRTVQLALFTYPAPIDADDAMEVSVCTVAYLVWMALSLRTT